MVVSVKFVQSRVSSEVYLRLKNNLGGRTYGYTHLFQFVPTLGGNRLNPEH